MEAAVRIAVAYLGEIVEFCVSSENGKRNSGCGSGYRVHRKGDLQAAEYQSSGERRIFPSRPGILLSQPHGKEAIIFSEEFPGILSLLVQQGGEADFLQHMPVLSENEFSYADFSDFENIIIKASNSLGTMIFETKERFLISHMLMTKLALETLNGSEYIHEAESLD